ncbi:MAG: hypothetical protein Q6366_002005, partial [Candidatus Freyarchaeota archaeon]
MFLVLSFVFIFGCLINFWGIFGFGGFWVSWGFVVVCFGFGVLFCWGYRDCLSAAWAMGRAASAIF